MSTVPFEYWAFGSGVLTFATVGMASLFPIPSQLAEWVAPASLVFWSFLWAYSPLPQGFHRPGHRRRKQSWGFSVEYEEQESPQQKLSDYSNEQ